ncbi:MAG: iron transporter [Candidatus Levybacteria bacterium RIFCSPHIGHO2_02_FULL_42_12]|nr:MAG: iron transporter [Candidatus Levybacteria bacterium RIFCSPHIGHO2_02_FULL_42_12]
MKIITRFFKRLGPGFITGASDDDPSGIATYAQTGALFGFSQTWTSLFSFPFMVAVQTMCGRVGLVTGKGLAGVIKQHYSKKILYPVVLLVLFANTINIGTDLGAIGASLQLLFGFPYLASVIAVVIIILALELFISYKTYFYYLKFLAFALFAYIAVVFFIDVDWVLVFKSTIIPHIEFTKDYLFNIVAVLGTTISPYLFFWQASEEVEEEVVHHKLRQMGAGLPQVNTKDISRLTTDTVIGMFFSNIVMFFIIIAAGATLFPAKIRYLTSAQEAAGSLAPLAGIYASSLFALGIIGTGLLAVPILAGSASYAVSEALGWKEGLYRKVTQAGGFYSIIVIATLIGMGINFIGFNPMSALYYTAVINGIVAVPLLIMIFHITNNKKIMGDHTNNKRLNILGIGIIIVMSIGALALAFTFFM